VQDLADTSPSPVFRRWTRRGFLITWVSAGAAATLLAACGPAVTPPAATSAPPAPAPTTPPAAAPTTAPLATTAPAAAAAPTSAPTAAAAATNVKNGGTFRFYAWPDDPPSLDPYVNVSYRIQEFSAFFYSRLLRSKKGPGIAAQAYIMEGDLAESWGPAQDGKSWTFKLRQNARWHNVAPMNGRPVTAQDVVWSFEHFMATSPQKSTFGQVDSVTAPDDHTVQFTLKDVYAPFEAQIGGPVFWVLPREVVEADGDVSKRTIGSGPFIFDKFESGVNFAGHKNPDYYIPGEPHIDDFVGLIIPDTATQMAGIRAHELDYVPIPDQELPGMKQSNPEVQLSKTEFNLIPFVYWKIDQPPFNDPRVRQAVSMMINRDNVIQIIYNGVGSWNNAIPWALSEWWLDPRSPEQGDTAKNFKYDPAAAKQLLAAAGYPDGLQVKMLSTPGYGNVWVQGVELVQADLKAGGVDANLEMHEYADYIASIFSGKFQGGNVLAYGLETPFTEPHDFLFNMYHPNGTRNHAGVNDPKLTAMIEQQARTLDKAQRKTQIYDIQRYLADQMYYPPGVAPYNTAGTTPWVRDLFARGDYGFGAEIVPKLWLDK
jgi:peptide/nickel transport system substrate-binding protein